MPLLSRLLLLPLLAPLLALLLLAALNPRPALSLRLLIWSSPSLPLGLWLAMAGLGGAAIAGTATSLALAEAQEPRRRTVRRSRERAESWVEPWPPEKVASDRQRRPPAAAAPLRPPGEPPPTFSVPFRVIRRPQERSEARAGIERETVAPAGTRVSVGDGWDQPIRDDW